MLSILAVDGLPLPTLSSIAALSFSTNCIANFDFFPSCGCRSTGGGSVARAVREGFNQQGNIEARGIIPRAIEQIFGHIQRHASPRMRFLVRASYLQIYNEQVCGV